MLNYYAGLRSIARTRFRENTLHMGFDGELAPAEFHSNFSIFHPLAYQFKRINRVRLDWFFCPRRARVALDPVSRFLARMPLLLPAICTAPHIWSRINPI